MPFESKGSVIVEGKEYSSLLKACKAYKKPPMTVWRRIQKGMGVEEAILTDRILHKSGTPVEFDGVKYHSISQACSELDLDYDKITSYMQRGMSFEEAVSHRQNREVKVEIDGKKYYSIYEACKDYGISRQTVSLRIKRGMSVVGAITKPIDNANKTGVSIKYDGKEYKSITSFCRALGLQYQKFSNKVRKYGVLNIDLALKEYYRGYLIIGDKHFKNLSRACKYFDVDYSRVYRMVKNGTPAEDAVMYLYRNKD
jgi:hypothetical protein